jgi:hypothetical protein
VILEIIKRKNKLRPKTEEYISNKNAEKIIMYKDVCGLKKKIQKTQIIGHKFVLGQIETKKL